MSENTMNTTIKFTVANDDKDNMQRVRLSERKGI